MKKLGAYLPPPENLPRPRTGESLASAPDRASYILRRVRMMYGCYRRSESYDPEIFAAAAAAVLSDYDLDIVDYVTDPRTGLPSRIKWPPEAQEIRSACDALQAEREQSMRRERLIAAQLAEREQIEREQADRSQRPSYEELRARYDGPHGEPWGIAAAEAEDRARKQARAAAEIAANDATILRAWAALGREPPMVNGRPISPALARQLGMIDAKEISGFGQKDA